MQRPVKISKNSVQKYFQDSSIVKNNLYFNVFYILINNGSLFKLESSKRRDWLKISHDLNEKYVQHSSIVNIVL